MTTLAAAIPWFRPGAISLGPISLQPFGILVATGVLFGAWTARLRARQINYDEDEVRTLAGYQLVFGFLGAHWFDILFYQPGQLTSHPFLFFKIWQGISSYGGFLGAAFGYWLFCRRHKAPWLATADITMWGILPGFIFGRMGCSSVHDHAGRLLEKGEHFFLAVDYPGYAAPDGIGGLRYDLGIYELFLLVVLLSVLLLVTWGGKRQRVGFACGLIGVYYGGVRFFLERYRLHKSDPLWGPFHLTFAQYVSVATFLVGIAALVYIYTRPAWAGTYRPRDAVPADKPGGKPASPSSAKASRPTAKKTKGKSGKGKGRKGRK